MFIEDHLEAIFVLSLPTDRDRRSYVADHFRLLGVNAYEFVDGKGPDAHEVKHLYRRGLVAAYPECFRCCQTSCDCANNILIPKQIANWVSFIDIWKRVASLRGPALICEDDVYFYPGAMGILDLIAPALSNILSSEEALVRLGRSGLPVHNKPLAARGTVLTSQVAMSNVAHIMTPGYARRLLSSLEKITTTSDVYVHRVVPKLGTSNCVTVNPLIATDLSYNPKFAKFASRIHPKGISDGDEEAKTKHVMRAQSEEHYLALLESWIA